MASDLPEHLRPFLFDLPERPRERGGRVDIYPTDTDEPSPAIVFVHGGPIPPDLQPMPRDWPSYVGYGTLAASNGAVGVTVDLRLYGLDYYAQAAADVAETIELVRADPRVDADRIALWHFSGGGLLTADWLAAPPPWLRCIAATYPVLAPMPGRPVEERFRPAEAVAKAGDLPIILSRAELERPAVADTIEEFVTAARACDANLQIIDVAGAHHGFETIDHTDATRSAVTTALNSVLAALNS